MLWFSTNAPDVALDVRVVGGKTASLSVARLRLQTTTTITTIIVTINNTDSEMPTPKPILNDASCSSSFLIDSPIVNSIPVVVIVIVDNNKLELTNDNDDGTDSGAVESKKIVAAVLGITRTFDVVVLTIVAGVFNVGATIVGAVVDFTTLGDAAVFATTSSNVVPMRNSLT